MFSLTYSWLRTSLPDVLLQLRRVNSVGAQDDCYLIKWGRGGWKKIIYVQQNRVCLRPSSSSLLALLACWVGGGTELQSALLWSVTAGFLQALGHVCHCFTYLHVGNCVVRALGMTEVDPCPLPWLQGGQPDSVIIH